MSHRDIINAFRALPQKDKAYVLGALSLHTPDECGGHIYCGTSAYLMNFAQNRPDITGLQPEQAHELMESYFNQWF